MVGLGNHMPRGLIEARTGFCTNLDKFTEKKSIGHSLCLLKPLNGCLMEKVCSGQNCSEPACSWIWLHSWNVGGEVGSGLTFFGHCNMPVGSWVSYQVWSSSSPWDGLFFLILTSMISALFRGNGKKEKLFVVLLGLLWNCCSWAEQGGSEPSFCQVHTR